VDRNEQFPLTLAIGESVDVLSRSARWRRDEWRNWDKRLGIEPACDEIDERASYYKEIIFISITTDIGIYRFTRPDYDTE
jgi:hypothetical protein